MTPPSSFGWNQSQILVPKAKPDETVWGHLYRTAALNNLDSVPRMIEKWSGGGQSMGGGLDSSLAAAQVLRLLASADTEEELHPYAWRHGMGYMLVLSMHSRDGAKALDYYTRSALHEHACLLPARHRTKFCRRCQIDAMEAEGFTWFRRIHQAAGIEFCPSHHEMLEERPANLQRPLSHFPMSRTGALQVGSGSGARINESDSAIHCYTELVSWRWRDTGCARLSDIHDLVAERARTSRVAVETMIREAIRDLQGRPQVRAWFTRHFQHLLLSPRPRWRPHISLYHLALTLASHGGSMEELFLQLSIKRSERNGDAEQAEPCVRSVAIEKQVS